VIRIVLPHHLRTLIEVDREVVLDVDGQLTIGSILDQVEAMYPVLRGTIRDPLTQKRRPFIRFFACEEDFSNAPLDAVIPDPVARGDEPLHVVGAMAGG
jgi:hypothetical protein